LSPNGVDHCLRRNLFTINSLPHQFRLAVYENSPFAPKLLCTHCPPVLSATLVSPSERAKGRISGESHEQKERSYELNQKDSADRRRAVSRERSDGLLQHHLCSQQAVRIWRRRCDTQAELDDALRERCAEIFTEQLAGWFNDETTWPQDRGLEVFRRWFDFQYHSMLVNLCDDPLVLEL
jgi:hypothetical protein